MNDDRERIAGALRKVRGAEPPPDLARNIKSEIPGVIGSGTRGSGQTYWLLAATLVLLVAGGWFAALILRSGPTAPQQIAEQSAPRYDSEEQDGQEIAPAVARDAARDLDEAAAEPPGAKEEASRAQAEPQEAGRTSRDSVQSFSPQPAETIADSGARGAFEEMKSRAPEEQAVSSDLMRAPAAPKAVAPAQANAAPPPPPPPPARTAERERTERAGSAPTRQAEEMESVGALEKAAGAELADKRLDAVEGRARSALGWAELRELLLEGRLPSPDSIDSGALIDEFDYGDRPPWRRGSVSLFVEGGAAPLSPSRWRTVRIGIRSRASSSAVATGGRLEIQFDPETVALYREIGTRSAMRTDRDAVVESDLGTIPGDLATSRLFEVKLLPDVALDQVVARAVLRSETDRGAEEIDRIIRVGHVAPTWRTTSSSLQVATLAGALAEYLGGQLPPRTGSDLAFLAKNLAAAEDGDARAAELVDLVNRAVTLRMRR